MKLFRRMMTMLSLCLVLQVGIVYAADMSQPDEVVRTDILVVGATPCGIAAAISAARSGSRVILTDMGDHMGGMMTNGLGRTDIGPRYTIAGIFREFIDGVYAYYVDKYGKDSQQVKDSSDGFYFEPSVSEKIFNGMVSKEKNIKLRYHFRPDATLMYVNRLHGVTFMDTKHNKRIQIRAAVTIDATYEGDIAAMSGVSYRVGRESREEFGEPYGGVLYMDHYSRMILPGSTGDGDKRVQSYNFRLTLTDNPDNRVFPKKPENYNRDEYLTVIQSIKEGRIKTVQDVLNIEKIPNGKSDTNNMPRSLISTDLPEENYTYPEAGYSEREKVIARHRDYTLGLIYFLQNDPDMPKDLQAECRQWGFSKDEFPDNGNFPRQIYVREARRIWGLYNFTAHDAMIAPGMLRTPIQYDSIACGGYAMDSHATRKREPGHDVMEGFYYLGGMTQPYQIPYRVMVPQSVDALLVPGAASGTHIGFGTLRMEPVWMAIGQAAGTAAHLARNLYVEPRDVPVNRLQTWLLANNQIITAFQDAMAPSDSLSKEAWQAMQFWGTRGFFDSYDAKPADTITRGLAAQWLMTAFRQGDFMTWFGPSTKHTGGGTEDSSLTQLVSLKILDAAGDPNAVLSEAEMTSWLGKIQPWIDGSIGDNWTKRVRSVDAPEVLPAPSNPDQAVTRAQFCQALFARYRSATPAPIP